MKGRKEERQTSRKVKERQEERQTGRMAKERQEDRQKTSKSVGVLPPGSGQMAGIINTW